MNIYSESGDRGIQYNQLGCWIYVLLALAFLSLSQSVAADQALQHNQWAEARALYKKAQTALAMGRITQFKSLKRQLESYPLYPYLEYAYLRKKIRRYTPGKEVQTFLKRYHDTPLAPQLKHYWLRTLAKRGQWQTFLDHFDNQVQSTELKCYALWAQYKTGDRAKAIESVQPLWLVGYSQPKACDPIFKVWRDQDRLDDQLTWQRFSMAIKARNTQLARYLIRYMSPQQQKWAKLYRELHFYPQRLKKSRHFNTLTPKSEEILLHAITRLARKDAPLALNLWNRYQALHRFSESQRQRVDHRIILGLANQDQADAYEQALAAYPYPDDISLLEAGIDMSIRLQDWPQVSKRIDLLHVKSKQKPRWQYWMARALIHPGQADAKRQGLALLNNLADRRDYYGFLAVDRLGSHYNLNQQSYGIDGNFLEQFKRSPGIERATELFLLDEVTDARREWFRATRHFTSEQHYTAAHYAYDLAWYSQAISSAINAERWDDLKLRFPIVHQSLISRAAENRDLNANWLFAVARQESAMNSDAQSPKGALGLMQIMPATATIVSRRHNIRYRSRHELLQPEKNILLGSAYLKDLLARFDGNSIYATAAYNAGPHRVNRWLKETADLPIDIWIETIPFAETRQYVKNVLAYSVIFAQLQQQSNYRMATAEYLPKYLPELAITNPEAN